MYRASKLNAFGEDDRFLFEALADHIAIAMRNAHLYRSEVWRRRVADSVREVAGLLSADVDLDRVLDGDPGGAGAQPAPGPGGDLAAGRRRHESTDVKKTPRLAPGGRSGRRANLDLEIGLTPEEVLAYNLAESLAEAVPGERRPGCRRRCKPRSRWCGPPGRRIEPLGAAMQFPARLLGDCRTAARRATAPGVLVLAHHTPGRYGSEASGMTAAFASYAAVAIENARLYEEAHEQAWVSTVLLQVANATQSLTDLNELLATVIHITPMLAGVRACLLYILDDDGDFVPAAASGLNREQQAEFERWRFAPGDVPALDHLVAERQPVILYGGEDDQRLTGILYPEPLADDRRQTGLIGAGAAGWRERSAGSAFWSITAARH